MEKKRCWPHMVIGYPQHHSSCSLTDAEWVPLDPNVVNDVNFNDVPLFFLLGKSQYSKIAEIILCPHCDMSQYINHNYGDILRMVKRVKKLTLTAKLCSLRPS